VGGAARRFVVRAAHLNHPVFRELLRQAEEEYGFPSGACAGPIALPCDEGLFEHVLRHLSSPSKSARFVTLEDLESGALSCCCVAAAAAAAAGDSLPLLRGISADKAVWWARRPAHCARARDGRFAGDSLPLLHGISVEKAVCWARRSAHRARDGHFVVSSLFFSFF
jgi:hypothetical protein